VPNVLIGSREKPETAGAVIVNCKRFEGRTGNAKSRIFKQGILTIEVARSTLLCTSGNAMDSDVTCKSSTINYTKVDY